MPRKTTITYSQLRVGIVISIALAIFLFTTIYITREGGLPLFGGQYTLYSYVGDVNGLKPGAPVHLSGVAVGSVTRVEFAEPGAVNPVRVTIKVRRDVQNRITEDSFLSVGSLGVLGEKMVDVDPGPPGSTPLEDQGILAGEAGDPIKGIITDASSTLKDVRELIAGIQRGEGSLGQILKGGEFHQKLLEFVDRAQDVFGRMEANEGTLGKLINDPAVYDNLRDLSGGFKDITDKLRTGEGAMGRLINDKATADSLSNMIQKLDMVASRIADGEGSIGALVSERDLYDKLNSMSSNLDAITARLSRGEGTAGQLLQDRELYDNLNGTANELQGLIKAIREDPKKYLRIKVSLF
jgi:phospholipid/cholesterol/gamma-HCH transport system substrate-binding protein